MRKNTLLISFFALATAVFTMQTEGKKDTSHQTKQSQSQARLRKVKESRRTKEQPIKIIGDDRFIKKTETALSLIKEKSPTSYAIVTNYISIIQLTKKSGMDAKAEFPTFNVGLTTSKYPLSWYASAIVHDSYHTKLYHDYRKDHKGKKVPDEIWTGRNAENECLTVQEAFLKEINAPEYQIKCVQRNRHIDYFSDMKSRNW